LLSNRVWPSASQTRPLNGYLGRKLQFIFVAILVCLSYLAPQSALSQVEQDIDREHSISESTSAPSTAMGWVDETEFGVFVPVNFPDATSPSPALQTLAKLSLSSVADPLPFVAASEVEGGTQVREVTQRHPNAPEQEIIVEGLVSYGNYKIFASGYDEKLFTAGVEYDRHSWGYFLKARMDYVAEFLPFVLLNKPLKTDIYGNPGYPARIGKLTRQLVPGVGISPIGFRMQWRSSKAIKPYLEAKGGMLGFTKKVPSNEATYENFSLQTATGVQVKMSDRWGVRLGLFSDFHFSDAFIVPVNPGLDVMNANLGFSYHF